MGVKRVINGVYVIPMGMANAKIFRMQRRGDGAHVAPIGTANAYLIEGGDGLTLIDAGYPGREAAVFEAIRGLGRSPDPLKHLIFTHAHPDHIGSAAAIVRKTGAKTYMHPLDIPTAETRGPFRPLMASPGLARRVMCELFFHPDERLEPVAVDQPLTDNGMAKLPVPQATPSTRAPGSIPIRATKRSASGAPISLAIAPKSPAIQGA
ncbi:MAG TPA: MBL fold metallo-hydrolase [Methylocella sp.]|nr:MBL fold metallo-hydrolase [Methylocella sp.]